MATDQEILDQAAIDFESAEARLPAIEQQLADLTVEREVRIKDRDTAIRLAVSALTRIEKRSRR